MARKEKVAKLGIEREDGMMYFIKDSCVWKVPRKKPGQPHKGKRSKVVCFNVKQDTKYLYFLDKDGDVSRAMRASAKK